MTNKSLTKTDLNNALDRQSKQLVSYVNKALAKQDKRFDKKLLGLNKKLIALEKRLDKKLEKLKEEIISETNNFFQVCLVPYLDKLTEKINNNQKIIFHHEERITTLEKARVVL